MQSKRFEKLCMLAITGHISPAKAKQLQQWLSTSTDRKRYFDELKSSWESIRTPQRLFAEDVELEWNRFESKVLKADPEIKIKANKQLLPQFSNMVSKLKLRPAYVFGFAIVVLIISMVRWHTFSSYQTIKTSNGQNKSETLSDGSVILINAESQLTFPKTFSEDERIVSLQGECFFEVQSDHAPFIVITEGARTQVLGTKFNVWARDEQTRVIVNEGQVKLYSSADTLKSVTISAGQKSSILRGEHPDQPVALTIPHVPGWLRGMLHFDKTPLPEALDELERRYDVEIQLDPLLSDCMLTAQFKDQSVSDVLEKICIVFNATLQKQSDDYYIINSHE